MANDSITSVLFHNRPLGEKKPDRPRPIRPSLQQFLEAHPVNPLEALRRNADAAVTYEREQARASRPRTFRPYREAAASDRREAA
jgi:hypothetical protein